MKQSFARKNFLTTSINRAVTRIKSYFTKNNSINHQTVNIPKKAVKQPRFPISAILLHARHQFDMLTEDKYFSKGYLKRRQQSLEHKQIMIAKAQKKRVRKNTKNLINESTCRLNYYAYSKLAWNS